MSVNKLNTLNNEHKQKMQELKKDLNDKEISFNKYTERLNALNSIHEKEIQELKKEIKKNKKYINNDKKDKDEVIKKLMN